MQYDPVTLSEQYQLIIFDLDGTLSEFKTGAILPGVTDWFSAWKAAERKPSLALASNQGGVGLRFWMETEGFGTPRNYPTQGDVANHVAGVLGRIGLNERDMRVYLCFSYLSKKTGMYSPVPFSAVRGPIREGMEISPRWRASHRKPRPGMLNDAITDAGLTPDQALMVGDWDEDKIAAHQAGCAFVWADGFFNRG
jgi:predicted HAD superfamily phosphohydrolase YqeG